MVIKEAVAILGAVCFGAPVIQTLRFRRFGLGSPWRFPAVGSLEGAGWLATASAVLFMFLEGALAVLDSPWYRILPTLPASPWLPAVGLAVGISGAVISFGAQAVMSSSWRVGTDPDSDRPLVTAGLFGRVRNPIYLGVILQFLGAALIMPTVVSLVALADCLVGLNLVVASEERFLTARYGEVYRSYMAATGRFLPRGKGTA